MTTHLFFQIIGGVLIGWMAGLIVGGKGLGLLMDLIIGVLGVILGAYLVQTFHIPIKGFWGEVGASVGGAVILLLAIRLINRE